jgi:hypothetical protein
MDIFFFHILIVDLLLGLEKKSRVRSLQGHGNSFLPVEAQHVVRYTGHFGCALYKACNDI